MNEGENQNTVSEVILSVFYFFLDTVDHMTQSTKRERTGGCSL